MNTPQFWVEGGRILIQADRSMNDRIKLVPGYRWNGMSWSVPASPTAAKQLRDAFEGTFPQVDQLFIELVEAGKQAVQARARTDLPPFRSGTHEPWMHQRQGFYFARELPATMLGMDMGTGKTLTTIGLLDEWEAKRVLIMCPRNVVGHWPYEFGEHSIRDWNVIAPPLSASVDKRVQFIATRAMRSFHDERPLAIVINHEAAWRPAMAKLLLSDPWDAAIVDESHRAKSAGGKFSMFLMRLRDRATRRLCLTGTPMPHSPLDIYAQYRFLDPSIFGTSVNRFKRRYAVMGGYEDRKIVDWVNEEEMAQKIGSIMFSCKAEDVLDLEEPIHTTRPLDLEAKTLKVYRELKEEFVADVEGELITAANGGVKVLRLQQITSGYARTDEGGDIELAGEKRKMFADLLEDFPTREPVVVFCRFHHDLDVIRAVAEDQGRRVGEISGRTQVGKDDCALTPNSRMRPDIDVAAVQIQAGGVGIDLTRSRYGIYYSVGHSLGDYLQSLKRMDRPGQVGVVEFFHLVAKGTVDIEVYRALREKRNVVEAVIEAAKRGDL